MLFPLLFLVTSSFAEVENEYDMYLFQERWLPSHNNLHKLNFSRVSDNCKADTKTWLTSIFDLPKEFECMEKHNCTKEQKAAFKRNIYALKQLDAFGRLPAGMLDIKSTSYGSQEECEEVSKYYLYQTKYCFLKSTLHGGNCSLIAPLKTAVCMPRSCSNNDITLIFNELNFAGILNHCSTVCVDDRSDTNAFTWIFTAFMGVLVTICLIGTVVDYVLENVYEKPSNKVANKGLQAILVFSIYSNGGQILDTKPAREGHLKSLDCIRFFSMAWVVSGHVMSMYMMNDSILSLRGVEKPILVDTLLNAWFSVDSFFVLSGLLVSYMFFKMAKKNPKMVKSPFTWIMFYVHRYLRLTPPYMLWICFFMVVGPLETGAFFAIQNFDKRFVEPCRQNWWQNMLYINNFFDQANTCYSISWYLACDTQMYIAAPIVLIAFFLSHVVGLASVLGIGTGSVIATMVIIIKNNLPGLPTYPDRAGLFQKDLYVTPWIRCTPYLIGMYTGYLLANHGHKKIKIHPLLALCGWIIAIPMALLIVYGPHKHIALEQHWSETVDAIYYSFSRIGWGLFISWVVIANHFGWAGPISSFMCHPLWQPFGRLSYNAYIVHEFIVFSFFNLFDRPLHFVNPWQQFLTCTIPITVLAYVTAFVWSCLCEHPFLKLEKLIIDGLTGTKKVHSAKPESAAGEQNGESKENWNVNDDQEESRDDLKL